MKKENLENFREQIDKIDEKLIYFLGERFEVIKKVGKYKKENNIAILQKDRWKEVLESRKEMAKEYKISEKLVEDIFNLIHIEALEKEK